MVCADRSQTGQTTCALGSALQTRDSLVLKGEQLLALSKAPTALIKALSFSLCTAVQGNAFSLPLCIVAQGNLSFDSSDVLKKLPDQFACF